MAGFSTLAPPVFPSGTAASDWYGLCCFLAYFLCFPNSLGIESWCSVFNILSFLQCYLPLSPCNFHLAGALPILHSLCSSRIEAIYCRLGSSGARAGLFLNFRVSYLSQGLRCSREQSGASGALNSSLVVSQFLPVLVRPKTSLCRGNARARKERTWRWHKLTAWALHHRCPKGRANDSWSSLGVKIFESEKEFTKVARRLTALFYHPSYLCKVIYTMKSNCLILLRYIFVINSLGSS